MDFKVGVSLWNQPANQALPSPTLAPRGNDFSDKLGLKRQQDAPERNTAGQQPPHQQPERQDNPAADTQARTGQFPAPLDGNTPDTVEQFRDASGLELYALGLQAGTHLSHVPAGLLASAEAAYRANAGMPLTQVPQGNYRTMSSPSSPAMSDSDPISAGGLGAATRLAAPGNDPVADLYEHLSAWLARKWPERNCLLLPRGSGVELLIRDHHLSADEQASLLAELLQRLPGSDASPQRIWINGQPVWQREPLSRIQGDAR